MPQVKTTPFSLGQGEIANLSVAGKFFRVLYASGPVSIRSPAGAFQTFRHGQGQLEPEPFAQLEISNSIATTGVFGLIQTADVPIASPVSFGQDDSTILTIDTIGLPRASLLTSKVSIAGTFAPTQGNYLGAMLRRRSIVILPDANIDAQIISSQSLQSLGYRGATAAAIPLPHGGTGYTLETDDTLILQSTDQMNGATVTLQQFWYYIQ